MNWGFLYKGMWLTTSNNKSENNWEQNPLLCILNADANPFLANYRYSHLFAGACSDLAVPKKRAKLKTESGNSFLGETHGHLSEM